MDPKSFGRGTPDEILELYIKSLTNEGVRGELFYWIKHDYAYDDVPRWLIVWAERHGLTITGDWD